MTSHRTPSEGKRNAKGEAQDRRSRFELDKEGGQYRLTIFIDPDQLDGLLAAFYDQERLRRRDLELRDQERAESERRRQEAHTQYIADARRIEAEATRIERLEGLRRREAVHAAASALCFSRMYADVVIRFLRREEKEERDRAVVRMMEAGKRRAEIACALGVSPNTASKIMKRLRDGDGGARLKVTSRSGGGHD
jgi:hypothetical protein